MDSLTFHSCETANLAGLNEGIGNTEASLTISDILQVPMDAEHQLLLLITIQYREIRADVKPFRSLTTRTTVPLLDKKFFTFHGNQSFFAVLIRACHWFIM
jgi:hypothetical protein